MISLHGAYENENFGDELLIAIQANWIQEHGLNVCLPFASPVYKEQIESSSASDIEGLKKSSHLIYTGGGYFGEPNHKQFKWGINFYRKNHHIPSAIFKRENKKYIISGVGAGPVTNPFTRRTIVKICNSAEKVIVRDNESWSYLKGYGVNPSKLLTAADVVLTLKKEDLSTEILNEVKVNLKRKPEKFYFGIHIGVSPDDQNYSEQVKSVMNSLAQIIKERQNIVPVLIADKRNAHSTQEIAIEYMSSLLDFKPIIFRHSNIWNTCALLSMLDGVITTKLHIGITAYSLGTKTFGIAAHQKTRRFYNQINKSEYFFELGEIDSNTITKIEKFLDNDYWDKNTLEKREELYEKALICKKEILKYVSK